MIDGSAKTKFAEDAARFLRMFSGFAAYAEEVGKTGSLEQAATEAEARLARAKQEADKIGEAHGAALAKAQAEADKIIVEATTYKAEAEKKHQEVVAIAQREAAGVKAGALAGLATARAEGEAELRRITEAVEQAKVSLVTIKYEIEVAKSQRAELMDQTRKDRARLSEITEQIAAVKQRLG